MSWDRKNGSCARKMERRCCPAVQPSWAKAHCDLALSPVRCLWLKYCKGDHESQNGDRLVGSSHFTGEETKAERGRKPLLGGLDGLSGIDLPSLCSLSESTRTKYNKLLHRPYDFYTSKCFLNSVTSLYIDGIHLERKGLSDQTCYRVNTPFNQEK